MRAQTALGTPTTRRLRLTLDRCSSRLNLLTGHDLPAALTPGLGFLRCLLCSRARHHDPAPSRACAPPTRPCLPTPHLPTELVRNPPEGISIGPKDDNLFLWEVMIVGQAGTALCVCVGALCEGQRGAREGSRAGA